MAPYFVHILTPDNTSPGTACDITQSESALKIIQTIGHKGWAVLKNSTAVSSASKELDVASNTVLASLSCTTFSHRQNRRLRLYLVPCHMTASISTALLKL